MKYINFNQLRSFHAVAKTNSITEAAKLLQISQPTITKQIQLLEENLTDYNVEELNKDLVVSGGELINKKTGKIPINQSSRSLDVKAVSKKVPGKIFYGFIKQAI